MNSTGLLPFGIERRLRHQEFAREDIGLTLRLNGEFRGVSPVFVGVKQQMAEFVHRDEDQAFHREPIPSVEDHRRATVPRADAQSEDGIASGLQEQELHPVPLEQSKEGVPCNRGQGPDVNGSRRVIKVESAKIARIALFVRITIYR